MSADSQAEGPFWRIGDEVAQVRHSPDRVVVFNLDEPTEPPEALTGTAAAIWLCLAGDEAQSRPWTSEPELIADLARAYATDPAAIAADVRGLLARLHTSGHLQRTDLQPGG